MSAYAVVDTFAGPGGWDEGLQLLGVTDVVGIEWDVNACATAEAAGHTRVQADVADLDPSVYAGADGVIASPPCPSWSRAGNRAAFADVPRLEEHLDRCADGWVDYDRDGWADPRTPLVLEPLRWVDAIRPRWVACEQVRDVLPFWRRMCHVLHRWGYAAEARILLAADYGVPQTRERAILLASRDGVRWPEPTHFGDRRRKGQPDLFGQPWVTVAEALPELADLVIDRRTNSKDGRGGMAPSVTVPTSRPAPTVTGSGAGGQWIFQRPAPTIIGTPRIARPGHRNWGDDAGPTERHFDDESIDVEIWQLGVLQGFRADYPWSGSRTSQGLQVGNAVPPPLAAAVLRQFVGAREVAA